MSRAKTKASWESVAPHLSAHALRWELPAMAGRVSRADRSRSAATCATAANAAVVGDDRLDSNGFQNWALGNLVGNENCGIFAEWLVARPRTAITYFLKMYDIYRKIVLTKACVRFCLQRFIVRGPARPPDRAVSPPSGRWRSEPPVRTAEMSRRGPNRRSAHPHLTPQGRPPRYTHLGISADPSDRCVVQGDSVVPPDDEIARNVAPDRWRSGDLKRRHGTVADDADVLE